MSNNKSAWDKLNLGLLICLSNVKHYPHETDILWEVQNLLCSLAKHGMLKRETVMQIDKLMNRARENK